MVAELIRYTQQTAWNAFKARLTQMMFPSLPTWQWPASGTQRVNYSTKVDARGASIVASVVNWTRNNFPEAPLMVSELGRGTSPDEIIPDHPLVELVKRPNPWYSGNLLWAAMLPDYLLGNAYWVAVPNSPQYGKKPVELWWVPSQVMEPKWPDRNNKVYISHYEMTVDNEVVEIPPENVMHFRRGLDPNNTRKGLSPLGALFRELYTDNEAADWTANLLANGAVPGLVISPDSEKVQITPDQAEVMKSLVKQKFGGARRGEPLILTHAAKVAQASFNPDQMNLRDIRRVPEERVTAVFGLAAVVCGLGAGLDRSTFANFAEAREAAYESYLIPLKGDLAEDLQQQLLPRFSDPTRYQVGWDYSRVKVLQEDQDKLHARAREDFRAGISMLDEAREAIGLPPLPKKQGQLFAVGMSVTLTPPDQLYVEVEEPVGIIEGELVPPALPPGNQAPQREPEDDDSPETDGEGGQEGQSSTPPEKSAVGPLGRKGRKAKG